MEICLGLEPGNVQLWRSKPLSYIAFLSGFLEPHALLSVFRPVHLIIFLAVENQRHLWSRLLSLWLQKDLERRTAEAEEKWWVSGIDSSKKMSGFQKKGWMTWGSKQWEHAATGLLIGTKSRNGGTEMRPKQGVRRDMGLWTTHWGLWLLFCTCRIKEPGTGKLSDLWCRYGPQ